MKKKKNSNLVHEDDSRFNRVLQRLRHHEQPNKNKESPIRKPKKTQRPIMSVGSENSLGLLFSQEAKENRPPEVSQSLADKRKKKNMWKWRPLRSLGSHKDHPVPCVFSVYVDGIHSLPPLMNAMQCVVKLYRKNGDTHVQTRPCRIINGTADIDETLQLHSSVSGRGKHECSIWVSVCVLEMGGSVVSTHCLDLSRVVPEASGLCSPGSWATTVKLTGKAKGALLVATFACQLVRDGDGGDSSSDGHGMMNRVCNTPQSCVSELDLNDVLCVESLSSQEQKLLDPQVNDSRKDFGDQKQVLCDGSSDWALPQTQEPQYDAYLVPKTSLNNLDSENDRKISVVSGSYGDESMIFGVVEHGAEMEYSVVEQGVEMGTVSTRKGLEDQETNLSEKMQKGVDSEWWQGRKDTYRGFREHMQLIEEELARLEARIDANDCWKKLSLEESCNLEDGLKETPSLDQGHVEDSLTEELPINERRIAEKNTKANLCVEGSLKEEEGLRDNPCLNERCIAENSSKEHQSQDRSCKTFEEDEKLEEAFLNEIQGFTLGNQMVNCSSDEDTDSVTNEFLNLLERGHNASDTALRRELNSSGPRGYEHDSPDFEMQKAEQVLRSKMRAKILEDAETQALMQEWGLNEDVFKLSPPKSCCLSAYGNLMGNLISSPPLEKGMGSVVQTKDGGYIRSMNPGHFVNSKIGGKLVMHVSKPVVISTEMGSTAMDILQRMAAIGMDNLAAQTMMAMPLEDITGKTIQQISLEGSGTLERPFCEVDGLISCGTSNGSEKSRCNLGMSSSEDSRVINRANLGFAKEGSKSPLSVQFKGTKDSLDGYVSAEDLTPLAMQKIEALALEGLRIQSNMTAEDAPFYVDPLPLGASDGDVKMRGITEMGGDTGMYMLASNHADKGMIEVEGTMESIIPLQKWMELNAGISIEDEKYKSAKSSGGRKQNDPKSNSMNETITIAMLVQLRDPLRNYEPVGAPMIALIQAERIIKLPRPKLSKQVCIRTNNECEEDETEAEENKAVQVESQFKITEVHMAGLKAPETEKKKGWFFQKWGTKKQEQSGSRWLIANGMGKTNKPALQKPKPLSSQSNTTVVKPGETLWSISSRVHGTGSKWQEIASLNPHIRNPDIIFPHQKIRTS